MSRFILTIAVLGTFALASANSAQAAPKPPSGSTATANSTTTVNKNIAVNKNVTVNKNITTVHKNFVGNGFRLRGYCGWSSSCWYPQYRCFLYYCPLDGQWYFWSEAMGRFLPISFLATNRPTTVGFGILPAGPGAVGTLPGNVGTQGGMQQGTGSPALPPGATELPPAGVTNNGGIN